MASSHAWTRVCASTFRPPTRACTTPAQKMAWCITAACRMASSWNHSVATAVRAPCVHSRFHGFHRGFLCLLACFAHTRVHVLWVFIVSSPGPVYRLKISPYLPQAVLTCSADWSVKLWDIGSGQQPCVFQTTDLLEAVTDVCWSKTHSTRFASVTGDGRIMLWDTSSFSPLIDHRVEDPDAVGGVAKKRLTSVLFANDVPVLVTGDVLGSVDVYRVTGLSPPPPTMDEQLEALSKSLHPA